MLYYDNVCCLRIVVAIAAAVVVVTFNGTYSQGSVYRTATLIVCKGYALFNSFFKDCLITKHIGPK